MSHQVTVDTAIERIGTSREYFCVWIWFKKSTPWKSKPDLEPVSESWIFQNFETRDTKNRNFHKFKKSVSSVFSLKRTKKIQNF